VPESVPQLIAFSAVLLGFGLVSRRLDGTPVTPPIVFAGTGLAAGWLGIVSLGFHQGHGASDTVVGTETARHVAEIAIVLFLFTGAARTDVVVLREVASLPGRLLMIGLPLTIGLGGLTAWAIFAGDLEIWEAFIVGSLLAPTDAAVGAVVVSSPLLPARLREALKVETGLNDGLAVPFFTIFGALAAEEELGGSSFLSVTLEKVGYAALVGMAVGLIGGWLVRECSRRNWMAPIFRRLSVIAMALLAWWAAEHVGGSGMIAAFVGGLATGVATRGMGTEITEFTEDLGGFLSLLVFFCFGVVAVDALDFATWEMGLYALLSLTVLRMIPVGVALLGAGMRPATVAYLGWFGPRGLASVLLAVILVSQYPQLPGAGTVFVIVTVTVLLSVILHGVTAAPLTKRYARLRR
jgi:sodium/hydrogen antiporter